MALTTLERKAIDDLKTMLPKKTFEEKEQIPIQEPFSNKVETDEDKMIILRDLVEEINILLDTLLKSPELQEDIILFLTTMKGTVLSWIKGLNMIMEGREIPKEVEKELIKSGESRITPQKFEGESLVSEMPPMPGASMIK